MWSLLYPWRTNLVQILLHTVTEDSWVSLSLHIMTARELTYCSASMQTDLKSSTDSPLKQLILSHSTVHLSEYSIFVSTTVGFFYKR